MNQNLSTKVSKYSGLVLSIIFLFIYAKQIDLGLTYYWQQTIAMPMGEYLSYPGGISDCLGILLIELLTLSFWGVIVIAILVLLTYYFLERIFKHYAKHVLYPLLILAALIPIFIILAQYRIPAGLLVSLVMGYFIAFVASLYKPNNIGVYIIYIVIFSIASYMIAGPGGLYIFIQTCLIDIVVSRKFVKLFYVLPSLFAIPVAYMLLLTNSYTLWSSFTHQFVVPIEYLVPAAYYIGLMIPLMLLVLFEGSGPLLSGIKQSRHRIVSGVGSIVVLVLLVYASWTNIDTETKIRLQLDRASYDDDWQEVLELGEYQRCANRIVQYQVNRALYFEGLLLDNMFKYPQAHGVEGVFLEDIPATRVALAVADFYTDMGFVNEARHWSNESHAALTHHPLVLKRLVLSYGAIGNEKTALKFNEVLSRSRLYKDWTDSISTLISEDKFHDLSQIQAFISNNPENEFFASRSEPLKKLTLFYKQNPDNHMAFEYKIAGNLLNHEVGNLVKHIPDFRRFGYEKIPRAVEEALLLYIAQTKDENLDFAGYKTDPRIIEEFTEYLRVRRLCTSKEEAMSRLSMFRHTYWYYVMFTSPLNRVKQN